MAARRARRAARSQRDRRPPVAIGHVWFETANVAAAAWLETVGLRPIAGDDDFAVLELRGGTHLVVTKAARRVKRGTEAPFDLMVDNLDRTHGDFAARGLAPSRIRRGSIHDSFALPGPDGIRITVLSSHAGRRPV